jgi:hypothetical protein
MPAEQKASVAQLQLDAIEKHPRAQEVLDTLDPEMLSTLRETPRTSWISPSFMAGLLTAAYEVGGPELTRELAFAVASRTSEHPLFRPLVQGTLAIFGKGAGPLFKTLPRAWKMVNRNSGDLRVEVEGDRAVVEVILLPPELDVMAFKESWVGTARGILKIASREGDAELELLPKGFRIKVSWS